MVYVKGALHALWDQQRGQIQLLIIAPIITLSVLGLVVRSASSAVDHGLEKQKIVEQLKRRLSEVQNEPLQNNQQNNQQNSQHNQELLAAASLLPPEQLHKPVWLNPAKYEHDELELGELDEFSAATSIFASEYPLPDSDLDIESDPADSVGSAYQELPLPEPQIFPFETSYQVRKRDTLTGILQAEGISSQEAKSWIAAAKKHQLSRKLKSGQQFSFVFNEGDDAPVLTRLTYEIDTLSHLVFEKTAEGKITVRTDTLPTTAVWRAVGGRITSSLYQAALKADVPIRIVDEMADMDWHLNFSSDLKSGDTFKIIFEEIQRDGKPVGYGRVLAAEIVNKGKVSKVFSFPRAKPQQGTKTQSSSDSSDSSTVTKGGQPFLRYPLRFTRISSIFTHARLHPILKRKRPHNGVDFAAPRGTPVRAVANGQVSHAGWLRGFGRVVRINHPGSYRTEYAHLHKIAEGVKVGRQVKRSQVIGTVGSTGLATGPHLHFGLFKNGAYVNPLGKNLPRTASERTKKKTPQPDPVRAKLKKTLTEYLAQLDININAASTTQVLAAVEPQQTTQATKATKPRS